MHTKMFYDCDSLLFCRRTEKPVTTDHPLRQTQPRRSSQLNSFTNYTVHIRTLVDIITEYGNSHLHCPARRQEFVSRAPEVELACLRRKPNSPPDSYKTCWIYKTQLRPTTDQGWRHNDSCTVCQAIPGG